jgi:hypothetical protein
MKLGRRLLFAAPLLIIAVFLVSLLQYEEYYVSNFGVLGRNVLAICSGIVATAIARKGIKEMHINRN